MSSGMIRRVVWQKLKTFRKKLLPPSPKQQTIILLPQRWERMVPRNDGELSPDYTASHPSTDETSQ